MKGRLVALGSAAVITVYTAGYVRTRAAAERWALEESRPPASGGSLAPSAPSSRGPEPAAIGPGSASTAPPVPAAPAVVSRAKAPSVSERPARPAQPGTLPSPSEPAVAATPALPADAQPKATPENIGVATQAVAVAPTASSTTPVSPATLPLPETKTEPAAPPAPVPPALKDGTYYGWGTSRHGDIQASVVIENGRITSAGIAQCLTRYSCSVIAHLPPQVISRQSADVDFVTGATQSTNAFYFAVLEALSKAR